MLRLTTTSPEQTTGLGHRLGVALEQPAGFMLAGSYGTGKTTFAQGLAQGLGVGGVVRSPSYSIVRTYRGSRFGFVHADLYRMKSLADITELGLRDLLEGEAVVAVEWPNTVDSFSLDMPTVNMAFDFAEEMAGGQVADLEQARVIELAFSADCPANLAEVASALTT